MRIFLQFFMGIFLQFFFEFLFRVFFRILSGVFFRVLFGVGRSIGIAFHQRSYDLTYITDGQKALHVVDHDQQHHVLPAVLLFDGRDKHLILDIVVDHGLGQKLVIFRVAGKAAEVFLQKGCDLVHVEVDPGNVRGMDLGKGADDLIQLPAHFFGLQVHPSLLLSKIKISHSKIENLHNAVI